MLAVLLAVGAAIAGDTWTDPRPGVRLLDRVISGGSPQSIHVALVDLCEPGMHPRATRHEERRQRTSDWAESVGAVVAVNGAFFSYDDYDAIGWSRGDGEDWPTAVDYDDWTAIGFGSFARAEVFPLDADLPPDDEPWWREMVPGWPLLVEDGAVVDWPCESHLCSPNPRTAAGLTEDGCTVVLAVIDGRSSSADGMTTAEVADLMVEMGAHDAVNFDGGGSTTMWVEGLGVVNDPSDGSERTVASHLGFLLVDGEEPCCLHEAVDGATGTFADVPDTAWYRGHAEALYAAGITAGCDTDPLLYCPDCVADRATAAVFVARSLGLADAVAPFDDVDPSAWYAGAVGALAEAGITSGCSSDPPRFCPDRLATRWEVAAFTFRGMGLAEVEPTGRFTDVSDSQARVLEALAEACVVSGCGEGLFCPDREVTRAEIAALMAVGFSVGDYAPCAPGDTGDTGAGPDTGSDPDTGEPSDDTSDEDWPDGPRGAGGEGCGCGARPRAPSSAWLGLVALLAARRRTRTRR